SPNAVLTHEASIGKLAEDEINYLVTRGFKRDEAVGILIRGFVSIDVKNIPERVKKHIETLERIVAEKAL
ncbi:MAG: SufD family Fe-S cluster assembly protein, partial [Desulfurococcaceae archaeon]